MAGLKMDVKYFDDTHDLQPVYPAKPFGDAYRQSHHAGDEFYVNSDDPAYQHVRA